MEKVRLDIVVNETNKKDGKKFDTFKVMDKNGRFSNVRFTKESGQPKIIKMETTRICSIEVDEEDLFIKTVVGKRTEKEYDTLIIQNFKNVDTSEFQEKLKAYYKEKQEETRKKLSRFA